MMSPFIQYFLFKEALHPSSIFGVIVIFFAGVLVGIKKIYFDPTNDVNMNERKMVRCNGPSKANDVLSMSWILQFLLDFWGGALGLEIFEKST